MEEAVLVVTSSSYLKALSQIRPCAARHFVFDGLIVRHEYFAFSVGKNKDLGHRVTGAVVSTVRACPFCLLASGTVTMM